CGPNRRGGSTLSSCPCPPSGTRGRSCTCSATRPTPSFRGRASRRWASGGLPSGHLLRDGDIILRLADERGRRHEALGDALPRIALLDLGREELRRDAHGAA